LAGDQPSNQVTGDDAICLATAGLFPATMTCIYTQAYSIILEAREWSLVTP